jgi:hypothetical protein
LLCGDALDLQCDGRNGPVSARRSFNPAALADMPQRFLSQYNRRTAVIISRRLPHDLAQGFRFRCFVVEDMRRLGRHHRRDVLPIPARAMSITF